LVVGIKDAEQRLQDHALGALRAEDRFGKGARFGIGFIIQKGELLRYRNRITTQLPLIPRPLLPQEEKGRRGETQ